MIGGLRWLHPAGQEVRSPLDGGSSSNRWILVIDLQFSGVSAILIDCTQSTLYPIQWANVAQPDDPAPLQLPASVYLSLAGQPTALAIGDRAEFLANFNTLTPAHFLTSDSESVSTARRFLLRHVLLYLLDPVHPVELPADVAATLQHQLDDYPVSRPPCSTAHPPSAADAPYRHWLAETTQLALMALLSPLTGGRGAAGMPALIQARADGLSRGTFQSAIADLSGVVLSLPGVDSVSYGQFLVAALLDIGLVSSSSHVGWVNTAEAIAAHISGQSLAELSSSGKLLMAPIVVFRMGAIATECTLVQSSKSVHPGEIAPDLHTEMAPIGQRSLLQALLFHLVPMLLNPSADRQRTRIDPSRPHLEVALSSAGLAQFQAEGIDGFWQSMGLTAAEYQSRCDTPSVVWGNHIQFLLDAAADGRSLQDALLRLWTTLSYYPECQVSIGDRIVSITQADIDPIVMESYLPTLDRRIERLLQQSNTLPKAVEHIICSGDMSNWVMLARWLQERFPTAILIRSDRPETVPEPDQLLSRDRPSSVAMGTARLVLEQWQLVARSSQ
jgi:hypothetical protein